MDYDHRNQEHGIFNLMSEYGDDWQEMITNKKGNYDFLIFCDIEFRNQEVRDELMKYATWLHELTYYDGVRLDAIGWTREENKEHSVYAIVLPNAGGAIISMEIGARYAVRKFKDMLGKIQEEVWISESGWADFHCGPGSVSIWIETE